MPEIVGRGYAGGPAKSSGELGRISGRATNFGQFLLPRKGMLYDPIKIGVGRRPRQRRLDA
jgi:hypothetical protein